MKILHIIPFLWSGAGNVVTRLAVSQQSRGEVAVVTSGHSKGQSDWDAYRDRLEEAGVRHFEIDTFDRSMEVFWSSVRQLRETVMEFEPDIVHCHAGVPAAAAAIVREEVSVPFLLIAHLNSWGPDRPDWMNRMDLWGFGRADRVICNAEEYRRILRDSGLPAERIVAVPWGLPLEEIEESAGTGRPTSGRTIGFVGRIEPRKRQVELVQAMPCLEPDDVRLELVGPVADAEYAARVQNAIDDAGLAGRVSLRGEVPNVYAHVRNWDLFVSLSSDEGQGIAILEAMALGTPVISTDIPGVREYLNDRQNGVILSSVEPGDVAATVSWALDHPNDVSGFADEARAMVRDRYHWDATVRAMNGVYSGTSRG